MRGGVLPFFFLFLSPSHSMVMCVCPSIQKKNERSHCMREHAPCFEACAASAASATAKSVCVACALFCECIEVKYV